MRHKIRLLMLPCVLLLLTFCLTGCDATMFTTLSELENYPYLQQTNSTDHSTEMAIAEKNYTDLQHALPFYENAVLHPWPIVPEYAKLKQGVKNSVVPILRARLIATGDLNEDEDSDNSFFDETLTHAVQTFQSRNGLKADGIVGKATLYELNVSPEERLQQIRMNIDRWAKLSGKLGDRFIMVNVPDYRLYLIEQGRTVLTMKAIVGKPERPTPEIISTITRLVLNPYWNVPKLIAERDIVPKVISNPDYLDDNHIRIYERPDNMTYEISSSDVDWINAKEQGFFPYHLRQEPGNDNALGLVKFEFQNNADIYMHDTPAKNLFDLDKRAFSSGCIRLERPFELAAYLMQPDPEWDDGRLDDLLNSGETNYIKVSKPTKVIITYLTVWADEEGRLQFRDDIYGWDMP